MLGLNRNVKARRRTMRGAANPRSQRQTSAPAGPKTMVSPAAASTPRPALSTSASDSATSSSGSAFSTRTEPGRATPHTSRDTVVLDTVEAEVAEEAVDAPPDESAVDSASAKSGPLASVRRPTSRQQTVDRPEESSQTTAEEFEFLSFGERAQRLGSAAWARVRGLTGEQWLWIAVLALAALVRFWGLGDKPLHHDESMHAYFSLAFAENPSSYAYDPLLHGPFQFHAEGVLLAVLLVLQHIFVPSAFGNPWINDTTARFLPALFGLGIVALPYGLRRDLGRAGALIAAFLLAISPSFVYFSRFLREDIYFNFFMFAMVVAAIRYAHERTMRRFIQLFAASVLAYATFEGFFLAAAIFGGFLAVLLVWDLSHGIATLLPRTFTPRERLFFSRVFLLLLLGFIASVLAVLGLGTLSGLSAYINKFPTQSLAQVTQLENTTVAVVLYASIVIALLVIGALIWQMYRDDATYAAESTARLGDADAMDAEIFDRADDENRLDSPQAAADRLRTVARIDAVVGAPGRWIAALRKRVDPDRQPFVSLLLNITWVEWFVAFVVGWLIFAALFWIVPGTSCQSIGACFQTGIGKGIWQGLYYWIQQQQVARGGQPFYYYLLLIPLYEQLACVFGVIGLVYSLVRPTRFRLFLAWWFVGSLALYSWAGEKMPWLSIHITLPLMLLAAVALNWIAVSLGAFIGQLAQSGLLPAAAPTWATRFSPSFVGLGERPNHSAAEWREGTEGSVRSRVRRWWRPALALGGTLGALLLLIPMVHSMLTLSQVDAANGPLEMMVYVQTTPDVDLVMNKINKADQQLYGGKHLLRIGVGVGEEWPFYWYLRDYSNVYYEYNPSQQGAPTVDVALMLPYDTSHSDAQTFMLVHPNGYQMKQYKLRSWFDEAYKPEPCIPSKTHYCSAADQWGSGVNLGPYLSYGSFANPHAKFDLGRAASRLWTWLWQRKPVGATGGSYDFVFIVRNGLPIKP